MATTNAPGTLRQLWPLLFVQDLDRSIAFYRDRLGFDVVAHDSINDRIYWCRLERGGASLMLQQAEAEDGPAAGRGHGVAFYFVCNDADAFHAEFTARGLSLEPPSVAHYGMKQLFVPEPDGYDICFESPTDA